MRRESNTSGIPPGCLAGIVLTGLLFLVPLFFARAMMTALTVWVCYRAAEPRPGVGIMLPALLPPIVAALPSILLVPDFAPPVAFVAGVMGPLLGADLLHMRELGHSTTGIASIGGAGTFDGIVLSGMVAALLA